MDKYIIVLCEGEHDIAFLTRILSIDGYTPYRKKVSEFDIPLNKLYIQNLANKKIENFEFKFQRPRQKVPYTVLVKDSTLVIFHNFDGDGNILKGGANSIIKMYSDLNNENRRKINKYDKLNYRFLYFLDSDDIGVQERLNSLRESLELDTLNHYELIYKENYEIGCYIFHDELHHETHGKLEDILLNLMKQNNEKIFEKSQLFINENLLNTDRQKRYICNNLEEKFDGRVEFKEQKSIISIAGQLQFSGSSNAVIIANSDYIKKCDIESNIQCINILKLFKGNE